MSADPRPDLIDHPLRTAASMLPINCTLNINFRTYDPEARATKPLQFARVNLVPSVGAAYAGETDQYGDLHAPGSTTALVVPNLQNLPEGVEFHFEVVGPVFPASADLTAMSYPVGNGSQFFPIAAWSTKGWKEPEGHWGHFKLSGSTFPALSSYLSFTVGCYVNVAVRYIRSTTCLPSPVPVNIQLSLVHNYTSKPAAVLKPGGILSDVFFDIVPDDRIEVHGMFQTAAIPADNITPIVGGVTVANQTIGIVAGELFGFPVQQNVSSLNLYAEYAFADSTYSAMVQTPLSPRLEYTAYGTNLEAHYTHLDLNQKICLCYNWFMEFVARRNLYVRAMKYFFTCSSKTWTGLPAMIINIDDGPGGAVTLGDTITAHLEYILGPRDFVIPHELTHALFDHYFVNADSNIYYPTRTTSHFLWSYSNEFFAFQEGFPQFVAGLFMDPKDVFVLNSALALFKYQSLGGPWPVNFGKSPNEPQTYIATDKLEYGTGMALESAFAASLLNFWITCLWEIWNINTANTNAQSWVQDLTGDGTLDPAAPNSPNGWLVDVDIQNEFAVFIIDAVVAASAVDEWGSIAGRISTRRVIDQIQKRLTSNVTWQGISWLSSEVVFDDFWVRNEFYVSSITKQSETEYIIVRSSAVELEYAAIDCDAAPNTSSRKQIVISKTSTNSLILCGIRFPLLCPARLSQAPVL